MFNACPPVNYNPMYVDGTETKMCLAKHGFGYQVGEGDCVIFDITSQTRSAVSDSEVVCRIEEHPSFSWLPLKSIDLETRGIQRAYIDDGTSLTPNYYICRATIDGKAKAGFARLESNDRPSSACFIEDGPVEQGVEYLVFTTSIEHGTLWDERTPVELDNVNGLMAEGIYTITPTIQECEEWCERIPQCAAYNWWRKWGHCWLKHKGSVVNFSSKPISPSPSDPARGYILRPKQSYAPILPGTELLHSENEATLIEGGLLAPGLKTLQLFDISVDECVKACQETEGCIAITYRTYEMECFRFKQYQTIAPNAVGDGVSMRLLK